MSSGLPPRRHCAPARLRVFAAVALAFSISACASDAPLAPAPTPSADVVSTASGAAKPLPTGITITLVVEPQGATAVPFTTTGKKLRDFSLDDNADPALPNAITFDKLKAGTYTIQAQPVSGLMLAKIACSASVESLIPVPDLASGTATIPLDAGESVSCTFTEVKTWQNGDVVSYGQAYWGEGTTAATQTLNAHFLDVYPSGVLTVGLPASSGFHINLGSAVSVVNYLPANGTSGPLTSSVNNPTTTVSGAFGGEVTALDLNIAFSDAGYTLGTSAIKFGDLTLCNETTLPSFNGSTVRDVATVTNAMLGGATTTNDFPAVSLLMQSLNLAFNAGTPTAWAQGHLVAGPCP